MTVWSVSTLSVKAIKVACSSLLRSDIEPVYVCVAQKRLF